ncbi:SDR family NAD(P)-dependent oxidoreductase [Pseudonocardia sp. KRD-184]|uniref:SDR family NAD(P)-dependent oxidoreductase n=1 Tax=Pseudonocardia oceani TaxID=2792013 RepID=A0ABS6U4C4_9PSEU|nr:SDR family NAD(P)-dependent oxidoreductase [Pseudonocardia oceani]MBW0090707.1 SDR family NAD(P)-dependent oxidoreductase [Pseudonocardia oceani]MBW0097605.1 SDR family NAD(P)-dependent oxidoreductase [Pseudonocardia oceani]MBW0124328.1 SDR family NAD(P)-dependent oxidoreductase [Pseudonocardia oceani]MBW0127074.1 SDR family NAD(P)-dependent oxidoreductase [Pseudonocardia oceani]
MLDDRVVVVTGAATGAGRDVARAAAARGAEVVLQYDPAPHGAAGPSDGRAATTVTTDLTGAGAAEALIDRVLERHGRVDCLVNGAGLRYGRPVLRWSEDGRLVDVHAVSARAASAAAVAASATTLVHLVPLAAVLDAAGGVVREDGVLAHSASFVRDVPWLRSDCVAASDWTGGRPAAAHSAWLGEVVVDLLRSGPGRRTGQVLAPALGLRAGRATSSAVPA